MLISEILSEQLVYALGWTIIHSLWQSSLIVFGYFLYTIFSNKDSAGQRYTLGILTLAILIGTTAITFWRALNSFSPGTVATAIGHIKSDVMTQASSSPSLLSWIQTFINQHMFVIVGFWFLGVLFLVFHFMGDCFCNFRIKNYSSRAVSGIWEKRLTELCKKMNLKKMVQIRESIRSCTPMTIGHLKPVIFFPIGLLAGIPADQAEAIIIHELAHISRRDYLINILQHFVDIIFFYR
jgi:beta-lactamase regulating signal transducer with metallopeptidase domain